MKNMNIGVANLVVSEMLKNRYFRKDLISETENDKNVVSDATNKLINILKGSPILQLEFKVFNNIENKHILNETLAPRYIDDNIKLFEIYTLEELNEEHKKLEPFIKNFTSEDNRVTLYNAISTLIEESLKIGDEVDVDSIYESFNIVLDHIKTPKATIEKNIPDTINEEVIEIAINKFNEKYESLNENEVNFIKKLVNSTSEEKQKLFEDYKTENIQILESLATENNNSKITKSLDKINEMNYNPQTIDNDIIRLFELNSSIK